MWYNIPISEKNNCLRGRGESSFLKANQKEKCLLIPKVLQNDDVYNSLKWSEVDGKELDKIIEGATIVGAEPTDYPLTDGITIYIKNRAGELITIDIGADFIKSPRSEDENEFYINMAVVPDTERGEPTE